jgi:hypothetical protein
MLCVSDNRLNQQQSQITPITRWSDLPANDQKFLEDLEKYITEQKAICEDLKTRSPQLDEYVLSIPADVNEVQKRFDTISHILFVDMTLVASDLKVQVYHAILIAAYVSLTYCQHKHNRRYEY